jgi:hypothetical protein
LVFISLTGNWIVVGGDLADVASMVCLPVVASCFHLGFTMFSWSGKELSTVGLCRKKALVVLIRSESMESTPLPLAINQERECPGEKEEGV